MSTKSRSILPDGLMDIPAIILPIAASFSARKGPADCAATGAVAPAVRLRLDAATSSIPPLAVCGGPKRREVGVGS
jgi:hypothetical protein